MNISQQSGVSPLRGTGRIQAAALSAAPQQSMTSLADVGGTAATPRSGRMGSEVIGRLNAAADKLSSRLSDIVDGEQLSSAQVGELRDAEVQFKQTLERINNALDGRGLAPGTLRRGYQTAINDMRSAVRDVLAGNDSDGDGDGDGDGGVDADGDGDGTTVGEPKAVNLNQIGVVTDQTRIGRTDGNVATEGDPTTRRINFAEDRIGERIDQMLKSDNLSDDQRAALLETRDAFSSTLDRLRNAMQGDVAPVTIARGFAEAMSGVRQGMREALATDDSGAEATTQVGDKQDAAGQLAGAADTETGGDPGGIIDPKTAQRLEQLYNAADSIGTRLENILSKDGLGDGQIAALETARDDFRTSLDSLRKSLMSSDMDVGDVRKAFMTALDGLVGDVHAAMNTSTPPAVYTRAEGLEFMGQEASDVDRSA